MREEKRKELIGRITKQQAKGGRFYTEYLFEQKKRFTKVKQLSPTEALVLVNASPYKEILSSYHTAFTGPDQEGNFREIMNKGGIRITPCELAQMLSHPNTKYPEDWNPGEPSLWVYKHDFNYYLMRAS